MVGKIEKAYKVCEKFKIISFDIFGTLVVRDVVNSTSVFTIAEKIAFEERYEKSLDDTILECELSLTHPRTEMIYLLKQLKRAGKTIIITSDMYLSRNKMVKVLDAIGIEEYKDYDDILISCDYNLSKKDKGLYGIICERHKVKYNEIIHIGDAFRSDYLNPKLLGMSALLVPRIEMPVKCLIRSNEVNDLNRFICNHLINKPYEYALGYRCFGPLLYGFSCWLTQQNLQNMNIFFLSREGEVFLKSLEILGKKNENMKYMLVSRRGILGATYWNAETLEDILKKLKIDRSIHFNKIISLLNISEYVLGDAEWDELKDKVFLSLDDLVNDRQAYCLLNRYVDKVKEESYKQFLALREYLDEIGFSNSNPCGIIDIGWLGSMQEYLGTYLKLLGIDKKIEGFYLGVHKNAEKDGNKKGFLFDTNSGLNQNDFFSFVGLLESVLSEQNGSIKGYRLYNGSVFIERCRYEYGYADSMKIAQIREGALEFVSDMSKSVLNRILQFDPFLSSYFVKSFANFPSSRDLKFYKELDYVDDSYDMGSCIAVENIISGFLGNIKNSIWKIAYIKSVLGQFFPARLVYGLMCVFK